MCYLPVRVMNSHNRAFSNTVSYTASLIHQQPYPAPSINRSPARKKRASVLSNPTRLSHVILLVPLYPVLLVVDGSTGTWCWRRRLGAPSAGSVAPCLQTRTSRTKRRHRWSRWRSAGIIPTRGAKVPAPRNGNGNIRKCLMHGKKRGTILPLG